MSKIKFNCKMCGNLVKDYPNNRSKYCSKECSYKDRAGKGNGMYGKKHSKKSKEILSKQRKGIIGKENNRWKGGKPKCIKCNKILSAYHCKYCQDCIKGFLIGKNSGGWRGGICPENIRLRSTKEYKLWRKAVFERDNYTCVWCRTKKSPFNADHIKPFSLFPELRFAIDNGRTLCEECHRKTDTYGSKSRRKKNV